MTPQSVHLTNAMTAQLYMIAYVPADAMKSKAVIMTRDLQQKVAGLQAIDARTYFIHLFAMCTNLNLEIFRGTDVEPPVAAAATAAS